MARCKNTYIHPDCQPDIKPIFFPLECTSITWFDIEGRTTATCLLVSECWKMDEVSVALTLNFKGECKYAY